MKPPADELIATDPLPHFPLITYKLRNNQAPVVRKVDSAIHWINHYPLDSAIGCRNT